MQIQTDPVDMFGVVQMNDINLQTDFKNDFKFTGMSQMRRVYVKSSITII